MSEVKVLGGEQKVILCRRCGQPLGEHDRGRSYAHICEDCCAIYKLCPDCGSPVELSHEQLTQGFACTGHHTAEFIGDFPTVETAPPPTSRKVTCPKCGFEFEEWEGVIIV